MAVERDGELTFEVVEEIGKINTFRNGWSKELNRVSWNGGDPKYDIREWDENHERMSKGITLFDYELKKLYDLLKSREM